MARKRFQGRKRKDGCPVTIILANTSKQLKPEEIKIHWSRVNEEAKLFTRVMPIFNMISDFGDENYEACDYGDKSCDQHGPGRNVFDKFYPGILFR